MLLKRKQLDNILFIDIETAPNHPSYSELSQTEKELWDMKHHSIKRKDVVQNETSPVDSYAIKAGIFAEFGKIVCISAGYLKLGSTPVFRVKSFYGHDEKLLLQEFADMLEKYFDNPEKDFICGHNIKEFDIPFMCRRMLFHGIRLPGLLDIHGKKPWELHYFLDTLQLWRFGDFKNYTSLKLLAYLFDIPSPKGDIDGSQVASVYYEENDLERIARYCEKDVVTVAKLIFKWHQLKVDDLIIEEAK